MGPKPEDARISDLTSVLTEKSAFARPYAPPLRIYDVTRWKRRMAQKEYSDWLNESAPVGSADAYKESAGLYGGRGKPRPTLRKWTEGEMRRHGYGEALSQKKATIRKRWGLNAGISIPPMNPGTVALEPAPNTYRGIF